MEQSKIYVSRSHGNYDGLGSKIHISSDTFTGATISHSDIYDFQNNVPLVDLSNCELMLFVACKTAGPTNDINNNYYSICNASVLAGAEYSVGFTETINCHDANKWTECFFYAYARNPSIEYCISVASTGNYVDVDAGGNLVLIPTFAYKQPDTIASYQVFSENGG